jgi:RNA polymerase sporulation-specific sigma factor
LKHQNEQTLLLQAQNGSNEAMEVLIKKYKPLVSSITRQYFLMGGETDDLVQEGMIGLFQAINTYNSESEASFKTFAILLIKRKVQTVIRSANRQKNKMLNYFVPINNQGIIVNDNTNEGDSLENDETGIYISSKLPDPEDAIISKETVAYIKSQIENKLTDLEKNVLQLFIAGNTYQQIATNLNISKKTVDNILFKVRRKLAFLKEE